MLINYPFQLAICGCAENRQYSKKSKKILDDFVTSIRILLEINIHYIGSYRILIGLVGFCHPNQTLKIMSWVKMYWLQVFGLLLTEQKYKRNM